MEADSKTWKLLPWLLAAAFVLRAVVALSFDSIAHPDEIYQYLEQGHRLAFGNGWIPWEYTHGLRSWIIPGAIALILKPFELLGIDSPYIYQPVIELILCAISLVVPWSMYRIGQALFSENTARIALILGCVWYQIVSLASRPLADVLSVYSFLPALALVLQPPQMRTLILAGALAGLTVLLRFQMLPVVAIVGLVGLLRWKKQAWIPTASFAGVMFLGGALDAYTWGVWFASIVVNIDFNLVQNVSSAFGVSPPWYYLYALVFASMGLFLPGLAGLALSWRRSWPLLASLAIIVGVFSLIGHKEPRFIFLATPVWLIGLAAFVQDEGLRARFSVWRSRWVAPGAVAAVALVSIAGLAFKLPRQWDVDQGVPIMRADTRDAYRYLSTQHDVTAIIDDVNASPASLGGYYDLHLDVPVYLVQQWAEGGDEARSDPARYASHVLKHANEAGPVGFSRQTQFGDVAIWRRDKDPPANAVPADYDHRIRATFNDLPVKVTPRW